MKYLKKFNEAIEDPDFIMTKIKEEFPYERVKEMYQDEIREWTPDGEDESWYEENNNGEAEDMIITQLIDWAEETFDKDLPSHGLPNQLYDMIQKEYDFLNTGR